MKKNNFIERFWHVEALGSTIRTEILAGVTTFLTMAYIIFVNPAILGAPAAIDAGYFYGGADPQAIQSALFVSTCLCASFGTLLMALLAKIPFAQAPGMGLNAFFAYTVMLGMGKTYAEALAIVLISGLFFLLLTVTGMRETIVKSIPQNIKVAITGGIGLFLAYSGLKNAGLLKFTMNPGSYQILNLDAPVGESTVVANSSVIPSIIDFSMISPTVIAAVLALLGLIIIAVLHAYKCKGYIFIGIIAVMIIGIPFGITVLPSSIDLSIIGTQFSDWSQISLFNLDFSSLIEGNNIFITILNIVMVVVAFSMVDMFNTLGTIIGTAQQAGMLDKEGAFPQLKKALLADSFATIGGAVMGSSTVTTFVESASGISEGGRTGFSSLITSVLFLAALVLSPIIGIIPSAATAPALIFVGVLMMQSLKSIDFTDMTEAVPAFITLIFMPLTFSIANGIAFGLMAYVLIKLLTRQFKDIQIATVVLALLFMLRFMLLTV